MKSLLMLLFVSALSTMTFAQSREVVLKTSSECGACKKRIEGKLNYTSGIKFAELDVPTKMLTVKFNTKKLTLEELKQIIAEIGYDADEVKANPEAVEKLPACCQSGGMEKEKGGDHH